MPTDTSLKLCACPHLSRRCRVIVVALQVEKNVRWLWRFIMMPVLFGLIGNALRFKTLQHSSISKACAIIFAGWWLRPVFVTVGCIIVTAKLPTCRMLHLHLQKLLVHMLLYVNACETHLHICYINDIKCCQAPMCDLDNTCLTDQP